MQKKTLWAGVKDGQIQFFSSNPVGTVEGLQGSRKFHVEGSQILDDNGANIVTGTTAEELQNQPGQQQTTG